MLRQSVLLCCAVPTNPWTRLRVNMNIPRNLMSCALKTIKASFRFVKMTLTLQTTSFVRRYERYYFHHYINVLWTILIRNAFYSVMNDNNDFVTFALGTKFLRPKQQSLISKQNHEKDCYAVIIL